MEPSGEASDLGPKELKSNLIAKRKSLEVCVSELLIPCVLKIVTVEMKAQQVKGIATKPEDLNLIP